MDYYHLNEVKLDSKSTIPYSPYYLLLPTTLGGKGFLGLEYAKRERLNGSPQQ